MNKKGNLSINPNYGKKLNRKIGYVIVGLIVLAALIYYLSFVYNPRCSTFECFQSKEKLCTKTSYLNDQQEATWKYNILGRVGSSCNIKVTLVQPKEGELGISKLAGNYMICRYPLGFTGYPEKDLSKCSGLLKENLQEIIIEKLHKYLVENLGKVDESLKGV